MPTPFEEKINQLVQTVAGLGKVGLLIVEKTSKLKLAVSKAKKILVGIGYAECIDYLEIMDALSSGKKKIYYIEKGKKLDGLVLEIIAEFEAGMVSLADRKNNTGLKTSQWNPAQTFLVIIMTRNQIEKSYPRLFEYINITQSI